MKPYFATRKLLAAAIVSSAFGATLLPSAAQASEEELLRRIDAMQEEIKSLRAQVNAATKAAANAAKATGGGKPVAISGADGITVYGRLDISAEHNDDGKTTRQVVQNASSRVGFKGQRRIADNLSGIMQIEAAVDPADGDNSKHFGSRNSYVGLMGESWGTIIAGKHDMPFKTLEGTASQLWNNAEAMEVIIHGKGSAGAATTLGNFHTRQSNVIQYWSPKFNDVIAIKLAYSPDEVYETSAGKTYRTPVYGGSVEFNNGKWNFGLATETQQSKTAQDKDRSGLKATAGMKLGAFAFGIALSRLDNDAGKKTDNWMIAGSYKLGSTVLKANYGESSETASGAADGLRMIGLELDYPLDKFTTIYGYYAHIDNEVNAKGRFEAGENKYAPAAGEDPSVAGIGVRYNF